MTLLILGAVVVGPVIGLLVARFPFRRSSLVLGVVALAFGMWSVLLLWPGGPPLPVVAVALFCVGIGGRTGEGSAACRRSATRTFMQIGSLRSAH